jgi:hypothetical protein
MSAAVCHDARASVVSILISTLEASGLSGENAMVPVTLGKWIV